MKKTLLLAGVASFIAFGARAADFSYTNIANEIEPYVGADYVYSYAKFGGKAKSMKDSYHSGSVYMGTRMYDYMGLEAFFQMSGKVQKFKFSDIVRTQLQHTYRLINPNGEDVSIYCRGCVFNIFTRDTVGNQVQNMIFATCDGGAICKKIANLLKDPGNIPIDSQYGSGLDQYR